MEYEHQELEQNAEWSTDDEELESGAEYETLESHETIGESCDETSRSLDDGKSFAVPDVSADITKGKAAKAQLGRTREAILIVQSVK